MHGSVVYGPDGELINIGGTILPHLRPTDAIHDISDANLAPGLRGENDQYLKFLIFFLNKSFVSKLKLKIRFCMSEMR